MASQYYTPFMGDVGATIGQALATRGQRQRQEEQSRLAGSAYMGDPQAMQDLMQLNPELGIQIQQATQKRKETTKQKQLEQMTNLRKDYENISKNIAAFPDFESAKAYADEQMQYLRERYPEATKRFGDAVFDEADFQQAKTMYGEEEGAFGGTSMDAQVSNMLTKGVEDPSFRNTPDYARAWQLANEPKIIRTPTGDITLRPELSPIFKPPGDVKSDKQQITESKEAVKKDVEIIPGTEKEIKTTADEKLSFGFYGRMIDAEGNIMKLGNFNSADIWERFKGITNITASPELQQYRQAADDWIRAKLRRESGAVIGKEEMQKEYEIYFPQVGDSQAVIDQKKTARKQAMEAMKVASGQEFKKFKEETKREKISDEEYEARKRALGL